MDVEGPPSPSPPPRDQARLERDMLRDAGATLASREHARTSAGGRTSAVAHAEQPRLRVNTLDRLVASTDPEGKGKGARRFDGYEATWGKGKGDGSRYPHEPQGKGARRFDEGPAPWGKGKGGGRGRGGQ